MCVSPEARLRRAREHALRRLRGSMSSRQTSFLIVGSSIGLQAVSKPTHLATKSGGHLPTRVSPTDGRGGTYSPSDTSLSVKTVSGRTASSGNNRQGAEVNLTLRAVSEGGLELTSPIRQRTATGGRNRPITATGDRPRRYLPLAAAPCRWLPLANHLQSDTPGRLRRWGGRAVLRTRPE